MLTCDLRQVLRVTLRTLFARSAGLANPSVFANRNFRLLFGGTTVSALGDQFTLVALPWLVLKLTGSASALGIVLAVMALPRAVFILIGGATVDRLSPQRVLLQALAVNATCIGGLAMLVFAGAVHMWIIYSLALGVGLSTAFTYPAASALLPQVVEPSHLRSANALSMGARQLSMAVGPALAGLAMSSAAHEGPGKHLADANGIGLAFSIDALTFLFSLTFLWMLRVRGDADPRQTNVGVLASVVDGVRCVWADVPLRAFVLYGAMVSLFVGGPLRVGLPVMADTRLSLGAASLGILMAANGGGTLVGGALAGVASRVARGRLGLMVLIFDIMSGLLIASLAMTRTTAGAGLRLACIGLLEGIMIVSIFAWVQHRVPQERMGRTMSVLMFTFLGLVPISAAAAGALLKVISLATLFGIAGMALASIALVCMISPQLRGIYFAQPLPDVQTIPAVEFVPSPPSDGGATPSPDDLLRGRSCAPPTA